MTIDRIKISQEINFNSMPTWIGLEASLLPDEDPKENLRKLQKVITEYQDEEQKAYTQSKWGKEAKPDTKLTKEELQKKYLTDCTTVAELETFAKLVKSNAHLQESYDEQLKKLTV